jgi:hypothetical protein
MVADDVRAIEFHPALTELLCAVDSFIQYRRDGEPSHVADIARNAVNNVDYHIGGDSGDYSIENMLGSPLMVAEFERMQRLLVPSTDRGGPAVA